MSTIALVWRTSSYSGTNGGQCVQVAFGEQSVFISDSKYVGDVNQQPMITLSAVQWNAVLDLALSAQSGSVDTLTVDLHQDGRAVRVEAHAGREALRVTGGGEQPLGLGGVVPIVASASPS